MTIIRQDENGELSTIDRSLLGEAIDSGSAVYAVTDEKTVYQVRADRHFWGVDESKRIAVLAVTV